MDARARVCGGDDDVQTVPHRQSELVGVAPVGHKLGVGDQVSGVGYEFCRVVQECRHAGAAWLVCVLFI